MLEFIVSYGWWGVAGVFAAGFVCGILCLIGLFSEIMGEVIGGALDW